MSSASLCIGFAETQFLSITAWVADANVWLLWLEPSEPERVLIRIAADAPADIQSALETAARLGCTVTTTTPANPD
jgi:hypothetical protein